MRPTLRLERAGRGDRSTTTQPRRHKELELNHTRIDVWGVNPGF